MKNLIKKILICIPIGIMLFSSGVKAEEIIGITGISPSTTFEVEFTGLRAKNEMYNFTLNGNLAFCLDPDLGMSNGLEYVYVGTVDEVFSSSQSLAMKKGWLFYSKFKNVPLYKNNNNAKLAAQVFIWSAQKGMSWNTYLTTLATNIARANNDTAIESFKDAMGIKAGIEYYYTQEMGDNEANAMQLYVWKPRYGTNNQRLVTNYKGSETSPSDPEQKTCQIDTWSNLATCSNNISNVGNIYQYAYGNGCVEGYTGNKSNKKGVATKSYGKYCQLYCLQDLTQSYPGNVATAVNAGRYLVWPNNNINNNAYKANANLAKYPMSITLNQRCKLYVNTSTVKEDYNKLWDTMNSAKYYNGINMQNHYLNDGCASLQSAVDAAKKTVDDATINVTEKQNALNYCIAANTTTNYSYTCSGVKANNGVTISATSTVSFADCCSKIQLKLLGGTCQNGTQTQTGTTPPNATACLSQQIQLTVAQETLTAANNKYDQAVAKLNACKDYGTKYQAVNSFINSFNNTCVSANVENSLNFTVQAYSSYDDPTYKGSFELENTSSSTTCQNCTSMIGRLPSSPLDVTKNVFAGKVNEVNNRPESNATITKTYDIKNGYYYYVNKKTNESVHSRPSSNYSIIGFSNMPISYNSKLGKKYNLSLSVSISGTPFDSYINSQTYSCYYKVNNIPTSCVCPEDSPHAGESLDCLIATENEKGQYQYTCADAQKIWCYTDSEIQTAVCPPEPPEPLTCPNDPEMDLKPCINSGNSYTYCYNKYCISNPKHYHCPAGTSNEGMNLDACVIPMIEKGTDEQEAYNYCVDTTCPAGGIKIIYRTISLVNPFPSYNADKTVSQNGLSTGMFNDTVKGRYPGSNWNSTTIVKNKILNNRNTDGDKVYSKEPLYTIILDGNAIKEIRNYNDKQKDKYSDFTLSCKKNNSSACVSKFLRDYNLISSGTCKNISADGSNFYTCDD